MSFAAGRPGSREFALVPRITDDQLGLARLVVGKPSEEGHMDSVKQMEPARRLNWCSGV